MSTDKPRDFWIDPNPYDEDHENGVYDAFKKHPGQGPLQWQASLVHVIEHSAYQSLQEKYEKTVGFLKEIEEKSGCTWSWCLAEKALKELGELL